MIDTPENDIENNNNDSPVQGKNDVASIFFGPSLAP
jgi:hypothetical protein